MGNLPAKRETDSVDLIQQANQYVLAMLFPTSRSAIFPIALGLAKTASCYREIPLDGRIFHAAFFSADIDAMKLALSLLNFARRMTHTQVYGRGQLINNPYRAASVIQCYMNSLKPSDHRAHCHIVKRFRMDSAVPMLPSNGAAIPDIDHVDIEIKLGDDFHLNMGSFDYSSFIVPCCFIATSADFKLSSVLPVSFEDQIRAAGAKSDCDWCPHFKPEDLKRL